MLYFEHKETSSVIEYEKVIELGKNYGVVTFGTTSRGGKYIIFKYKAEEIPFSEDWELVNTDASLTVEEAYATFNVIRDKGYSSLSDALVTAEGKIRKSFVKKREFKFEHFQI